MGERTGIIDYFISRLHWDVPRVIDIFMWRIDLLFSISTRILFICMAEHYN